ncbi:hypothetical protein [Bradyrhizobium sp. 21]|uniref:hypothetical protein n=1 Tax=Bradyrhizobium sp. 21 TaxID=2782666 RepID=UPI001FF7FFBB|nr:hypothetical protein [Bradyrhizobium sp. 21]MCK1386455.1 hypothetical protein [Bradyrhizobium sp. 21]
MERRSKAVPEQSAEKFILKDWAVFVPTLGTALAISWQVGSLFPLGGFYFFGLSDHLVAASKSLPIGLALSALVVVCYTVFLSNRSPSELSNFAVKAALCVALIGYPLTALFAYLEWNDIEMPFVLSALTLSLLVTFLGIVTRHPIDGSLLLFMIFTLLIMLSTSFANDLTLWRLSRIEDGKFPLSSIVSKSGGVSKGVVFMAGDRGYLLYAPRRSVTFIRSDEVVMIDIARSRGIASH